MGWKRDLGQNDFVFLVHIADFVAGESSNTSSNLQIESDVNILTERPPLHKLRTTKQKLHRKRLKKTQKILSNPIKARDKALYDDSFN